MNYKETKQNLKIWMKKNITHLSEKCKHGKLSAKSIGIIIRTIHMTAPYSFVFTLLFGPYFLCNLTIIFLLGVLVSFYTFDSCFLSVLELNLCNDDFVIIDPVLELCDLEINTANRYYISNVIGIPYLITICMIYYIRFYVLHL